MRLCTSGYLNIFLLLAVFVVACFPGDQTTLGSTDDSSDQADPSSSSTTPTSAGPTTTLDPSDTSLTSTNDTGSEGSSSSSGENTLSSSESTSDLLSICGDGVEQPGEECDLAEGESELIGNGCDNCQISSLFCAPRPEGDPLVTNECYICLQKVEDCCAEFNKCLDHTQPYKRGDECVKKFDCAPDSQESGCKDVRGSEGWDLFNSLVACLQTTDSDCLRACDLNRLP